MIYSILLTEWKPLFENIKLYDYEQFQLFYLNQRLDIKTFQHLILSN